MILSKPLTIEEANQIYDVLIANAGAMGYWRGDFLSMQTQNPPCAEYRFQGNLGFGGKFRNYDGRWYVTCYTEDETPKRLDAIAKTNVLLAELKARSS